MKSLKHATTFSGKPCEYAKASLEKALEIYYCEYIYKSNVARNYERFNMFYSGFTSGFYYTEALVSGIYHTKLLVSNRLLDNLFFKYFLGLKLNPRTYTF